MRPWPAAITTCLIVAVAGAVYDVVEVAVKAERTRRGLPTEMASVK